jgi:hypothetical protein
MYPRAPKRPRQVTPPRKPATAPDPTRSRLESPPPSRVWNIYASVDPARSPQCALIISCERRATIPLHHTRRRSHDYIVASRWPSTPRSVRLCTSTSTTQTGLHPPALDAAPPAPPGHAPLRTHTPPFSGKAPIRVSTHTLTGIRAAHTPNAGNPGKTLDQRTKVTPSVAGQPDGTRVVRYVHLPKKA